jgi:hypothetical protein
MKQFAKEIVPDAFVADMSGEKTSKEEKAIRMLLLQRTQCRFSQPTGSPGESAWTSNGGRQRNVPIGPSPSGSP